MERPTSMRAYVAALREIGEVNEVTREVDWSLELGLMASRCYETGSPAPLFTNVKDASRDFSAMAAVFAESAAPGKRLSRIALAVGLAPDATAKQIIDTLVDARGRQVPSRTVDTGPCKENVRLGSDVDMGVLPMPVPHNGDGGRYLSTMGMIVCRTPDGSWTSWSVARVMYLDATRGTGVIAPFQHIGHVHAEWREIGEDMPFAIALGVPPAAFYAAGGPLPDRFDEAEFAGALNGSPIDVVKCETVDLEVPATAEIVIEGHVSVSELALEGPMGEMAGYLYPPFSIPNPVYNVTAMTYRNDAIYPFAIAGPYGEEDHTVSGVMFAAEAVYQLREAGLPVTTAWSPFETSLSWLVVTVPDTWPDYVGDPIELCRRIGSVVMASKGGTITRTVIVCNDDIDPSDLRELTWMLAGRHDMGDNGMVRIDAGTNWPMYPYIDDDFGNYPNGAWNVARTVWNCLPRKGFQRPVRVQYEFTAPDDLKGKIAANWAADGFPPN